MNFKLPNVPGITFSQVKPYLHRRTEYRDTGYSGHIHQNGRIHIRKTGFNVVKVSNAWLISFKNTGNTTVDVMMGFSVHDQYGKVDSFAEVYRNLRPGEPAEVFVELPDKNKKLMFEIVEIYAADQMISGVNVKQFLPPLQFPIKNWVLPLILSFISAMALTEPAPDNFASVMIPILALFVAGFGLIHRTPVIVMMIAILLIPFTPHSIAVKLVIFYLGIGYLYFVWTKRFSMKDFFRATATPPLA